MFCCPTAFLVHLVSVAIAATSFFFKDFFPFSTPLFDIATSKYFSVAKLSFCLAYQLWTKLVKHYDD